MPNTYVIGDIHGELTLVNALLQKIHIDFQKDRLIFLGDYIDRGPASKEVLSLMEELQQKGAYCLMGNHEHIMLSVFTHANARKFEHWVTVAGGRATLESYGYSPSYIEEHLFKEAYTDETLHKHLRFIETLLPYFEEEDTIFVHGGLDPEKDVKETPIEQLLWIREEFHLNYHGTKTIVFGHTPTPILHKDKNNHSPYFGENRIIGIDGGAVFGGQLHCLVLPSKQIISVSKKE